MSNRARGVVVVAVSAVLLVLSLALSHPWEQITDAVLGGAVMVVGLAIAIFAAPSHGQGHGPPSH